MSNTQTQTTTVANEDMNTLIGLVTNIEKALTQVCAHLDASNAPVEAIEDNKADAIEPNESEMTRPVIKVRRIATTNNENKTIKADAIYYIPSIPKSTAERCTEAGLIKTYGIKLPPELQDVDLDQLTEKYYKDINDDLQRVLVPLFKQRRTGEHYQDYYQRVGLLLPPVD